MDPLIQYWHSHAEKIISGSINLALSLAILAGAFYIARVLKRLAIQGVLKAQIDDTLAPIAGSLVKYFVIVTALVAVLDRFGVNPSSILALLGAAGLAIALSLKDTLQHLASGLILLFLRPFRVGDTIETDGNVAGNVEAIDLFTTTLRTGDGIYQTVPNGKLWGPAVKNFSRNPTRRMDVEISIVYGDNLGAAQQLLLDILKADSRVRAEPPPVVVVNALGDKAVTLLARGWTLTQDHAEARWHFMRTAKETLEAKGYTLPSPPQEMRLLADEGIKSLRQESTEKTKRSQQVQERSE